MDKYTVDFNKLDKHVNGPKVYRLADVQHKIEKVAFDIVRFRENEDTDQLWKIEQTVDGPVIVAMYDKDELVTEGKLAEASVQTQWAAVPDKSANVNVFYKGEPITKIAASKLGIPEDEVSLLCRWLPNKLASDDSFRASLLKDLSEDVRGLLLDKYPELG